MELKIFLNEATASVYWKEYGRVHFAPIEADNTCDLDGGGEVEFWPSNHERDRVLHALS